jgi:transcriptional regulator with XRE-family HTH domain
LITGAQIRAARALLRWTIEDLARQAGVASRTIKRFEQTDLIPPNRSSTLVQIQRVLEAAGIEFIGTPERGPGLRIWSKGTAAPNEPTEAIDFSSERD